MPIISSFFGIYIRMYFADHAPPHIHVDYQGHEALVAVADGRWSKVSFLAVRWPWALCPWQLTKDIT